MAEPMVKAMRRRRLEWFGHLKRRDETETIRAVAIIKIDGMPLRGKPRLRWGKTLSGGTWKHCTSGSNYPLTGTYGNVSAIPVTPHNVTAAKCEKSEKEYVAHDNETGASITGYRIETRWITMVSHRDVYTGLSKLRFPWHIIIWIIYSLLITAGRNNCEKVKQIWRTKYALWLIIALGRVIAEMGT